MKYDLVIFDIDDTLMDFAISEQAALQNAFMDYGLPSGFIDMHDSYRAISRILWNDLEQGKIALQDLGVERFRRLFLEHGTDKDPQAFSASYLDYLGKETHLMAGAVEALEGLTHSRLAIMTNGFGEVQKARLENSPIGSLFEHIIISQEAGFQKPHPGIFDYAFSKLGNPAKERTIIVGDSLTSDIQGGNNYGIDTVWFNPENKPNTTGILPTYEIHDLLEVVDIVSGVPAGRRAGRS
ncbi:YjjG family noncanonical pyrimidine nucleotidase [Planococcus sp. CAU13]|uniref:YjjG family noncanonical pyrimidine nucleotidase n=1 Tax=Planococcus sp. CAU13 TaxID=1541197 RepID=UPI00052FFB00|nr:YjjG family noncanonical pyrimidine nucleotidase [Planococcus sp. CAU13]